METALRGEKKDAEVFCRKILLLLPPHTSQSICFLDHEIQQAKIPHLKFLRQAEVQGLERLGGSFLLQFSGKLTLKCTEEKKRGSNIWAADNHLLSKGTESTL